MPFPGSAVVAIARYWGNKPPGLVRGLLRDDDEVVVDPFGGAGSIVYEALKAGKRVVYSDINPYAWLIAYVTVAGAPREELQEASRFVTAYAVYLETRLKKTLSRDWLRYGSGE